MTPQSPVEGIMTSTPLLAGAHASGLSVLSTLLATLDDSKAEEIITIDLDGKSALADAIIIASGRSHRHVGAIADHVQRALKDGGFGSPRVEGLPHADWVLIDTGDVIVNLFRPEVRSFYNMEKMWDDSFSKEAKA